MEFNSHADRVVRVAVDLVNLLTPGEARGRPYEPATGARLAREVTEVLRAGGGREGVTEDEAAELGVHAALLRDVFTSVSAGDLDTAALTVNRLLTWTGARPKLERHDGSGWHLHFHAADRTLANGWAAGCATGLAVVLGGPLYDRLGVCTAPHCDRVYVDVSRNGARRFCSTTCQNRVKTAAFRARQAAEQGVSCRSMPIASGGPGGIESQGGGGAHSGSMGDDDNAASHPPGAAQRAG